MSDHSEASDELDSAMPGEDNCDRLRDGGLGAPAFQRAVLQALNTIPVVRARTTAPFVLAVDVGDNRSLVRLDEAFKRYRHGQNEPDWVAAEIALAVGVDEGLVAEATGVLVMAEAPFPRLARWDHAPSDAATRPCPFDSTLVLYFVRELPSGHIPLTEADLRPFGYGPDAWLSQAVANLERRTPMDAAIDHGSGDERVLGYSMGDGFDAARVLLGSRLSAMAGLVNGTPLVAIPSRDVLMLIGNADEAFVAGARDHVAALCASHPSPVSDRLYRLDDIAQAMSSASHSTRPDPAG